MKDIDVTIREAVPDDAKDILNVLKKIGSETDFLLLDEKSLHLSTEEEAEQLAALYDSPTNILLVALANNKIIATASIINSDNPRINHIGEVGISILKDFWGMGLGTILLEELIFWAQETKILRRLELTVQARNQRAIHLYQKFGFEKEGVLPRGAKSNQGDFLDVWCMGKLLD